MQMFLCHHFNIYHFNIYIGTWLFNMHKMLCQIVKTLQLTDAVQVFEVLHL